ncbi:MAG: hypothetical protein SangKO_081060 [Sandaracinaceae bacterium]
MSWVTDLEAALARGRSDDDSVRVLSPQRPPILDADGIKAVVAPLFAAIFWGAAIFREMIGGTPLDPIAVVLRLLALGMTLRVLFLGAELLRRIGVWIQARSYGLALSDGGLLFRTPEADYAVAKADVIGISERGRWQERSAGRRYGDVYVVLDPEASGGRTHLALPPVFEDTPGLLAERLMRWRGAPPEAEPKDAAPAELASRLYDDAVKGDVPAGVIAIRHDRQWLRKAPYAPVLAGVVAVEALLRAGSGVWQAIEPWMGGLLVLALMAIPARWLWQTRREVKPRKGLALVMTPAEVLIRTRAGMLRVRWKDLAQVTLDAKKKWSVLEGAHRARQLVLLRATAPAIRYDEPYLGLPVEVAKLLLDAYRTGQLPRG